MDEAELDNLVARINQDGAPHNGFLTAYVIKYQPPTIGLNFDNNADAEAYVFAKRLSGANGLAVEPANGSRVVWLR